MLLDCFVIVLVRVVSTLLICCEVLSVLVVIVGVSDSEICCRILSVYVATATSSIRNATTLMRLDIVSGILPIVVQLFCVATISNRMLDRWEDMISWLSRTHCFASRCAHASLTFLIILGVMAMLLLSWFKGVREVGLLLVLDGGQSVFFLVVWVLGFECSASVCLLLMFCSITYDLLYVDQCMAESFGVAIRSKSLESSLLEASLSASPASTTDKKENHK